MTETFELAHARGSTRHWVGPGALEAGLAELAPELEGRTLFLISSEPILALHGAAVRPALASLAGRLELLEVPDGEAAKTPAVSESLWRRLIRAEGRRDSLLVAFGGGSVGDLTGFVAGSFLRGIAWLQIPTTLLAQVDAAIGGKTAVDLPEAKNAVGLFHHPLAVVADARWLESLDRGALRCGLVEAIKTAALLDPPLLERIEGSVGDLLAGSPQALGPVVVGAARAKARLVTEDPEESGPRMLLNFGHTLGHAIETVVGHGRIAHGDAVAHGLGFALRLSVARGGDPAFAARLGTLLGRLGVPPLPALEPAALLAAMARDKKSRRSGMVWVVAEGAGRGRVEPGIPIDEIGRELGAWLAATGGKGQNSL